jgi:putative ABC transport system permease protein
MSMRQLAMYFRIAFRSVWRNRRRTALTMASVVFGTIALVTSDGLIEGIFANLREYVIHSRLGHIQITKPGYRDFASLDPEKYSIDNFVEMKQELVKVPGVVAVTKRFEFFGFISNGQATVAFLGTGVEPEIDARTNTAIKYVDGGPPYSEGDAAEVSIGVGLARKLHLKVGDNVTLLTTYGQNAVNAVDADIVGIFESGVEAIDALAVTIPMDATKKLLNVSDDAAHTAVVVLDQSSRTEEAAATIRQLAASRNWPIQVETWDKLSPVYHKVVQLFTAILVFLRVAIILVVVFSITNTITMTVYERFREIGSIRAIGTSRGGVTALFILEGAMIGLLGALIGAAMSNVPRLVLNGLHITLPPPPILTVGLPLLVLFRPVAIALSILAATGLAVFASIYPARKAGRADIVSALRAT